MTYDYPTAFGRARAGLPIRLRSAPGGGSPAVEVRTVTIDRPVPVPCVKRSAIPAEPPKISGKLTGDARRDLDTVTASAVRLRSWGVELVAILSGCTP
ncbi:hypothetical protein H5J25_13920 [Sphingomonas aliaeris]|uniref:Uncharacterized protein n=1 Tax=Sphingomonas aliaeris TaxID=2759526 RepID=A0A974S3Z2_9SPHN|nr:hypothetical protein [Sphingomonas aliaeris]QQV76540.1 hypothetical protein H5J25_13920 [Sphingomonas aliaeris]